MSNKLEAINIGTDSQPIPYVRVNTRLIYFRSDGQYKGWSILQSVENGEFEVLIQTEIYSPWKNEDLYLSYPNGKLEIRVQSSELKDSSEINTTSALENASTSSLGRALGFLGIGIEAAIGSDDEISKAIQKQATIKEKVKAEKGVAKEKTKDGFRDAAKQRAEEKKKKVPGLNPDSNADNLPLNQPLLMANMSVPAEEIDPANFGEKSKMIVYFEHLRRVKNLPLQIIMAAVLQFNKDIKNGVDVGDPDIKSAPIAFRDFKSFYETIDLRTGRLLYNRLAKEYKVDVSNKTLEEIAAEK